MSPTLGRCLCGAVTVALKGKPVRMAQCHCMDCQRNTGTGHSNNAIFHESDVEVAGGPTRGFAVTADSGNVLTRHFCETCGSRMFAYNSGRPGMITLPVGVFEDTSWYEPRMVLYQGRRRAWDPELPGVPAYDAMAPVPPPAGSG